MIGIDVACFVTTWFSGGAVTDNVRQARRREHYTLRRNIEPGKGRMGTGVLRADSAIHIQMSRERLNFIMFLRNLCGGKIFLSPLTQTGLNTITLSRKKSTLGSYKDWYLRVVQLKASSDSNTPAYGFKEVFGYKNEGPCSTRVFHKTMGKGFGTVLVTFFSGS